MAELGSISKMSTINLLEGTNHEPLEAEVAAPLLPWFALQVRSRQELTVAEYLRGQGFEGFLPLYKCRKIWSDRIKEVDSPLFPGYLFCRFNAEDRLPVLKAPGIVQIVGFNRMPVPVDESEITAIQTLMASGIPNQPWPFLGIGDRVRIQSGPLAGLEGLLTDFKGGFRLVLSVTLLQRSVAVEIDSALVTSLNRSRKIMEPAGNARKHFRSNSEAN
jgi:transcription antitermination factor NusG